MKRRSTICGVLILLLVSTASFGGNLTEILYSTTDLGGGRWQYNYQVSNLGLSDAIKKFAIRFDYDGMYANLNVVDPAGGGASGWQKTVFQPDPDFEVDGEYNAKGKSPGIAIGQAVSGFAVSFDWHGTGTPGSQYYTMMNPATFEVVSSGWTTIDPSSLPEPATIALIGLGGIFVFRKWPKR